MPHTDITNDLAFDLYAFWEDEKARGNHVPLEEVCATHPELLPDVRAIAGRLAAVATLFSTGPDGDPGSPAGADAPHPADWREIGRGASSIVYRGEDATFGTAVAFKVLHVQGRLLSPADVVRLMKRFEQEARILARLKHDGIVRIFKTFGLGGRPVLEMEYLPGGSLVKHMEDVRAGGPAGIARFIARVARAVGFAHDHGIVHRDLKPSNILLDAAGLPCVSDFGVAKLIDPGKPPDRPAADPGGETVPDQPLTALGRQPGTKAYMAPEQFDAACGAVGPATDVWALGVILYELLHGCRPFTGGTTDEWAAAVCRGPRPLRRWSAWRVEGRLEAVALRCLACDPAKRFPSAHAVATALDTAVRPKWRTAALAAVARPRWRIAALAGAVACAAALGLALYFWPTTPTVDSDAVVRAAVEQDARAAFQQCADGQVAKGLFAFAGLLDRVPASAPELRAAIRANIAAWAGALATVDGLYTHPESISAVAASRDGRWVAVGDERGGVVLWDATTGRLHKRLAGHDQRVMSAAFSPDGRSLVTGSLDLTARVWAVEGPAVAATRVILIKAWVMAVAFTPDGECVVTGTSYDKPAGAAAGNQTPDTLAGVSFWNPATGERLATPQPSRMVRAFVVDASGENLIALTADYEASVWDLKHRRWRGPLAVPLAVEGKPVRIVSAAYSPDGKTIATGGDGLRFWDAETRELKSKDFGEEVAVYGFAPGGAVAVWAGGELRLWQPAAHCFDPLPTPRPTTPAVKVVAGDHLIGVEDRRTVVRLRWPDATARSVPVPRDCIAMRAVGSGDGTVVAVVFTPNGTVGKGNPGQKHAGIQPWDMRHNLPGGPLIPTPGDAVPVVVLNPGGRQLAFQLGGGQNDASDGRPVQLVNVSNGEPLGDLSGHAGEVRCAKYLKGRSDWVAAGDDRWVRVWSSAGKLLHAVQLPNAVVRMAVSPDERTLVVACTGGVVAGLDLSPDGVEGKWVGQLGTRVDDLAVSPDGRHAVARGRDRRLYAWALVDGTPAPALGEAKDVTHAFPDAGGAGWVTLHANGAVKWWPSLAATDPSREWLPGEGYRCTSLDPTGAVLVTAAADGKVQAWSVPARLPVGPPVRHGHQVGSFHWGHGNVLTISRESVRVWSPIADAALPAGEHLVPWLTALTGMKANGPLTDAEWVEVRPAAGRPRETRTKVLAPFLSFPTGGP